MKRKIIFLLAIISIIAIILFLGVYFINYLNIELANVSNYSDDIATIAIFSTDKPFLYEYWCYNNQTNISKFWKNEKIDTLYKFYYEIMQKLENKQIGYYSLSTDPAFRESYPKMRMFHIAVPLLGDEYEIVAQASNGQVALELILQSKFDVIFTDIKIPFIDGIKIMSIIRSHNLVTEFIVVSAYGDFELARQSISLDVAEYILKPVVRDDIIHALERVELRLNGKRAYTPQNSGDLKNKYPDAHPLVLKILDIIQIRYAEKINQKDLTKEIGVSPEYLGYVFSKNIGETFFNFSKNTVLKRLSSFIIQTHVISNKYLMLLAFLTANITVRFFVLSWEKLHLSISKINKKHLLYILIICTNLKILNQYIK